MKKIVLFYLLPIVFLMNSIAGYSQGENWRKITEMPEPRWGVGSCVFDGKIYVVGGCYTTESSPGKPAYHTVAMVNSFDPETGIWDTLAPLEVPRCFLQAVLVNGKIYAIGGSVSIFGESSSTVEVYDIENDSWERSDDMPARRVIFGACVLENQIYVMGGVQSAATLNNPLKSMDRYDPATGIWEACADMSRLASGLTVTPYKGKIYAIGGGVVGNNGLDIVEEYDPAEDVWIRKTSMSARRIFPCSAIVNDRIYVTGGSHPYPNIIKTEIYNPLTDTWLMVAGEDFLPLKSTEFSCIALDKKLYAFGGSFESPIHWSDPDVVEFDFPVVRSRSGSWLTSTDSLLVEFYEDGTLFIVPKGTPASKDSIFKYQIGDLSGVADQFITIQLDTLPTGSYEIFGIASDGRLDRGSSRFHTKNMVGIADVNFLYALIDEGVDTNEDSLISYAEAEAVTELDVYDKSISDLSGIEAFINLLYLYCGYNQLTSLDVSNNTSLVTLNCGYNQLTSLDVSNNTSLEALNCGYNQLTSLDVSNNSALTELSCNDNKLTILDVSSNIYLSNGWISSGLNCSNNQLTSLDVSNNTSLSTLNCGYNQLTSLDVSNNSALSELSCNDNQLTSLDVSINTSLWYLNCGYNQLTSLDVTNNTALGNLDCFENQLTSLDVSNCTLLREIIFDDNPLLNEVCVWAIPFPPSGVQVSTTGSPNIEFKDCTVGIDDYTLSELTIYPNPTRTILTIETAIAESFSIEISSLNGQQILIEEIEGSSHQIDLSPFKNGVYFITIKSKDYVTTKKIIKL